MCIHIHTYIYTCVYTYMYIYIYRHSLVQTQSCLPQEFKKQFAVCKAGLPRMLLHLALALGAQYPGSQRPHKRTDPYCMYSMISYRIVLILDSNTPILPGSRKGPTLSRQLPNRSPSAQITRVEPTISGLKCSYLADYRALLGCSWHLVAT